MELGGELDLFDKIGNILPSLVLVPNNDLSNHRGLVVVEEINEFVELVDGLLELKPLVDPSEKLFDFVD